MKNLSLLLSVHHVFVDFAPIGCLLHVVVSYFFLCCCNNLLS